MNMLSGYDKSIVTDIPGTTRDIVEESVIVGDFILHISDTAGLRESDDIVEKIGVEKARQKILSCDLVLAVFDSSKELEDEDRNLINQISSRPAIAVINKSDLELKLDIEYIKQRVKHSIYISAGNNEGKEELIDALIDIFSTQEFDPSAGILFGERQISCAKAALLNIKQAREAIMSGVTLDAVSMLIEYGIDDLMSLTGENASAEIVSSVFKTFCVGK